MDVRELYNALQLAFCCIISCIRESCRAPRRRWCSSSRSCRRSCRRILRALSTMLLPLGDGHRRVVRLGCCCCRASTSSWRRGAPLGTRQQAVLDKLSCRPQCLRHGQRRATEMLQFMCCHAIWTASFVLAALATVLCIQLAIALAAPTCCGISLPSSIGQATASRFTVWTLMRPPGARLRRERPHLLTCSREQRKNSGGGACG